MELFIHSAILHVINNETGETSLSAQELDIDSDICCEFIEKHLKKLLNNPATKNATFNPESDIHTDITKYISGEIYFKDLSSQIFTKLQKIMLENVDIPAAALLVTQFEIKDEDYIGIIKLNYNECFTNQVKNDENGADNQIVKCRNVLPFNSGKVEEACLIPYNPMILKLLEKSYIVNGEPTNYFSKLFLDCTTELSKKEAVQIINDISEEINNKFFDKNVENLAKVKTALLEEAAEQEGIINIENVASKVFSDNEEIKNEYITLARESGIREDLDFTERFTKQHFGHQKFKANNGIEVKFPAELGDDKESMEFIYNDDGSTSILLKNLYRN